eukprot:snap_masked-scaffold_68-processed-gene-0.75-mRNA-1 protein AED:1.00 eAED:1.00 QI:0/0/0/0/1/1/2/0/129
MKYENYENLLEYVGKFSSLRYIFLDLGNNFDFWCKALYLFSRREWRKIEILEIKNNCWSSFSKLELQALAEIIYQEIKPTRFSLVGFADTTDEDSMSKYFFFGLKLLPRIFSTCKILELPQEPFCYQEV